MRVLTLNVWGRNGRWAERRRVLREELAALRPDLIAFQEVIVDGDYDQVVDLLGGDYFVRHQRVGLIGDGKPWCVDRQPLADWRPSRSWISMSERKRATTRAGSSSRRFSPAPFGTLLFAAYGAWYPWTGERERELQAVRAACLIEQVVGRRDMHVLVCGDFNAAPEAASVRFWRGLQSLGVLSVCYSDLWELVNGEPDGHTLAAQNPLRVEAGTPLQPGRRIDYLFLRCREQGPTLAASSCRLVFNTPRGDIWASDHFGVVADLTLPERVQNQHEPIQTL